MNLPGWPDGDAIDWTIRRHGKGGRELRICYANARALERQTGVDLIYYNEFHGSFVLVQYKKFNSKGRELTYWPDSDKNFASELSRMLPLPKTHPRRWELVNRVSRMLSATVRAGTIA
jgi:hypothetical protein